EKGVGNMGAAEVGVCGIDALSAGAASAEVIDAEFLIANFDVYFVGFGKAVLGGGGGVDAALSFGFGDSLNAVGSCFKFHAAVYAIAGDGEDYFFEAVKAGFVGTEDFGAPVLFFEVFIVHAEEVVGEKRCLVSAGSGADFDNNIFFI